MNCISCGAHSGDGLLCPGCSTQDRTVPVFNLLGNSMLTDVRGHAQACLALGPTAGPRIIIASLPSLAEELEAISEKLERGHEPAGLSGRFERVVLNAGAPETMAIEGVPLSRECAAASGDIIRLGKALREGGSKLSARTENMLGNIAWLRSPVFSGKRVVDPRTRTEMAFNESQRVLEHYDRALASDPGWTPAMKNRALLLHQAGRNAEAIESCRALTDQNPEDRAAWVLMGRAYLRSGDSQNSIRCFDRSLSLDAEDPASWAGKADALMKMNRFAEALICFDRALRLGPGNPAMLNSKGDVLTRMGDIDQAVEAYELAKNLMPKPAFVPKRPVADAPRPRPVGSRPAVETPAVRDVAVHVADISEEKGPEIDAPKPHSPEKMAKEPEPSAREDHPREKMAKEPTELELEAELEKALGPIEAADEIPPSSEEEEEEAEEILDSQIESPEPEATEKSPRSLAEMFIGGLNIPEDEVESEEDDSEGDEWPSLPDEVDVPSNGGDDDEPVLAPLLGMQQSKEARPEPDISLDEKEVLDEIEDIESRMAEDDLAIEPEMGPLDAVKDLMENEDHEEALRRADALLREKPRDADAMALKGRILLELGRTDEGLKVLDRAVEIDPKNVTGLISRGNALCELDRHGEAMECFEAAIGLDDGNAEAWLMKGECQLSTGDYEEAIVSFNEVIERNKGSMDAWLGIGDAFLGLGREDDAYKCYDKATALDPKVPDGWSRLGDVLALKGRWGGALQMYDRSIKVDDEYTEAYIKKAKVFFARGMLAEADAVYSRLLESSPTDPDALTGKVEILIRKGKWGAALQSLKAVMRQYPDNARAWALQGDAYREEGRIGEAKEPYDKALELDPEEFTALVGKGRLMLDNGGYNEAIDLFRRAIDIEPENPSVWRFLGEAQKGVGKDREALKSMEMATEYGESIADNWMAYGMALHEAGQYPEAIKAFDRVTKIEPGHQEAARWREQSAKRLLKEAGA